MAAGADEIETELHLSPWKLSGLTLDALSALDLLVVLPAGAAGGSQSLFPDKRGDLQTDCSCPDWANPCKHIAAVYYLLGERFDQDPFLLFELRERRAAEAGPANDVANDAQAAQAPSLAECLDHYWAMGEQATNIEFTLTSPQPPFALLKRVGIPAFQGLSPGSFQRQMERLYDSVTAGAMAAAFADSAAPGEAQEKE